MPCPLSDLIRRKSRVAILSTLTVLMLAGAAGPAFASPFDDARDNILEGRAADAMLILSIGATSANERDEEGYTLLHYAARAGSLEAVKQLLERGADPTAKAKDGNTPMTLATTAEIRTALAAATAPAHPQ
ncbi:MAG TPA: ankyrin repeat domain-containing protein [Sphingobium sp.]|uniref:ankyrin repeat domain-containing protein n=1 Tax=Sphingobium sp. TaxID=1912891 RepID=UPI002ED2CDC2